MSQKRKPMNPHEFMQHLHKMHYMTKLEEELDNLDMIDQVVEMMGDELPEAEYIIQRVKRRLLNDRKY